MMHQGSATSICVSLCWSDAFARRLSYEVRPNCVSPSMTMTFAASTGRSSPISSTIGAREFSTMMAEAPQWSKMNAASGNGDAVALHQPEPEQRIGKPIRPCIPLPVGQRTVKIASSDSLRLQLYLGTQHLAEINGICLHNLGAWLFVFHSNCFTKLTSNQTKNVISCHSSQAGEDCLTRRVSKPRPGGNRRHGLKFTV